MKGEKCLCDKKALVSFVFLTCRVHAKASLITSIDHHAIAYCQVLRVTAREARYHVSALV